jgi:hypothetical protein
MSASPAPRTLPDWFTSNRVKGHTRLGILQWGDDPNFTQAAAQFEALGASVYTRHVKSRDEPPWGRDVWQRIIDDAHGQGLRIVGYYWHMAEQAIAEDPANAAWICRAPNGVTPIRDDDRISLDITGPYREVVLSRLLELAGLGVDGLMFDERHLPPRGCWHSALEDAWVAEKGVPAPTKPNDADPTYQQFLDFKAARIEDTFAYWRDSVKAAKPDVVFIVSTTTIPALTDREMTTRLARIADSPKNEYRLALVPGLSKNVFDGDSELAPTDHVRQAVGWTVLRDSAEGRPPHIWVSGVPNVAHARAAAGSLLTFGCIANMDVQEQSLFGEPPSPGKTPLDALRAAFKLGQIASPYLAAAQPVRWAAVHFAEAARNAYGGCPPMAWANVLWPSVGAFQVLTEDGLPVGVVNDHQLEHGELAGYRVLVLPDRSGLSAAQRQAVRGFAAGGGVVIETDRTWDWHTTLGRETALAGLRSALRPHIAGAPVRVSTGAPGRYAVAYRSDRRLVVAVTNSFSFVQITNLRRVPCEVHRAPPRASGVRIAWRKESTPPEPTPDVPVPSLRALEAISGTALPIATVPGGFRVELPPFGAMALLVVSRSLRPLGPREPAPDQGGVV